MGTSTLHHTARRIPGWLDPRIIRAHHVTTMFPALSTVAYIQAYCDRAVLAPGMAFVSPDLPESYLQRLRQMGIGANEVLRVADPEHMFRGVSAKDIDRLRRAIAAGYRIEFFAPTAEEDAFARVIGAGPSQVWGSTATVAKSANSKITFSKWMRDAGLGSIIPDERHFDVHDTEAIIAAASDFMDRYNGVVLKADELASGDGVYIIPNKPGWEAEVRKGLAALSKLVPGDPIILQEFYPGKEVSGQLELTASGPVFLGITLNHTRDGVHVGNTLSSGSLEGVSAAEYKLVEERWLMCGQVMWENGVRGHIGLDGNLGTDGPKPFDPNARVTGAFYAGTVGAQIGRDGRAWTVRTHTIIPSELRGYEGTQELLDKEGLTFNGVRGVVLMCPTMLNGTPTTGDPGKMMGVYIDATQRGVHDLIDHATSVIAGRTAA